MPKSSFPIGIIAFDEHELVFKLLGLRLEREMVIGMEMKIWRDIWREILIEIWIEIGMEMGREVKPAQEIDQVDSEKTNMG